MMKHNKLLLPCFLYPFIFMVLVFIGRVLHVNFVAPINMLLSAVCVVAGFICNMKYEKFVVDNRIESKSILRTNLILKCVYLPMNLYILFLMMDLLKDGGSFKVTGEMVATRTWMDVFFLVLVTVMTFGIALVASVLSGIVSKAGVVRAKEDGMLNKKAASFYKIGSYIPVADIVIAVWIWRKVKNIESGYLQ